LSYFFKKRCYIEREKNKKVSDKDLERWKLFYNLTREVYNREENRYVRFEDKALHCLTSFSLLLAIYGFMWKHILDNIFPPQCFLENFLSIFSVILLVLFILTWICTFRTFKVSTRKIMPLDEDMVEYIEDKRRNLAKLYKDLGEINKEAYEGNREGTDKEAKIFKLGYRMICLSSFTLIVFIIIYATYLWF